MHGKYGGQWGGQSIDIGRGCISVDMPADVTQSDVEQDQQNDVEHFETAKVYICA